ncbi:MAG: SDR family oxidoreductase [Marinosulfonomonas sp.]|nr:SDR family oxidoreductase [Marinosulfonomonas sp.]
MIVIFGATGTIATPLIEALQAKGEEIRAVTSNPANTEGLRAKGCDVAIADFTDPASLVQACNGADKAFLVTPADVDMRQWKANAIEAAKKAGVRHVVMSTGLGASPKAGLVLGQWHSHSQELLKASGMEWTLVQPTYFMQNLLWQAENIAANNVYMDDLGGAVSWVDARDIADVAALALTGEGQNEKAYGLTGPEGLSGEQIAALLSEVTGRKIAVQAVTPEQSRAGMAAAGMAPVVVDAMLELTALAPKGYLGAVDPTIENVLGRPARSFEQFIRDHATAFGTAS